MRTIKTTVYKFEELSEKAQQKAIEGLYDLNVNDEWWTWTYEDAENIGLKITGFDEYKVKGEFALYPLEICKVIYKEHGKDMATYQIAMDYMKAREVISKQEVARLCQVESDQLCECFDYTRGALDVEQDYFDEDVFEEINDELHKSLCEDYRAILQREYEYLTSEEAIKESIIAHEYEFTAEGEMI